MNETKKRRFSWIRNRAVALVGLALVLIGYGLDRFTGFPKARNILYLGLILLVFSFLRFYSRWRRRRIWWIHRQLRGAFIRSALFPLVLSLMLFAVLVAIFLWIFAGQVTHFYAEHWFHTALDQGLQCTRTQPDRVQCGICTLQPVPGARWLQPGRWLLYPEEFEPWLQSCTAALDRKSVLMIAVDTQSRVIRWGAVTTSIMDRAIARMNVPVRSVYLFKLPVSTGNPRADNRNFAAVPVYPETQQASRVSERLGFWVPYFYMDHQVDTLYTAGFRVYYCVSDLFRALFSTRNFAGVLGLGLGILFLFLSGVTGIVVLGLLFQAYRSSRRIGRAVSQIEAAMGHIAAGHFPVQVEVKRNDQLGQLARRVEHMSASLADLIQEKLAKELLERDLEIAQTIQKRLFPKGVPTWPGVDMATHLVPARQLSGDYYDFFDAGNGLNVVVADVVGKGFPASLLVANLHALLHFLQPQLKDPGDISRALQQVNAHLWAHTESNRFVTLFWVLLQRDRDEFYYAGAGHPPALLCAPAGVRPLASTGTILGAFPDRSWRVTRATLPPGHALVLYSDGLFEATNEEHQEYGLDQLMQRLPGWLNRTSGARDLLDCIYHDLQEWCAHPDWEDDLLLVVLRRLPARPS